MSSTDPIVFDLDARQFQALFGKTSQVPAKLRAALRKRIRQAAMAAAEDARQTVQKSPITRSSIPTSSGVRKGIAAGIAVQIMASQTRSGVQIVARQKDMPPGTGGLVRQWDKPQGWRHPVFGNRGVWTVQIGRPYFASVIETHKPEVTAAVTAAMKEAVESLQP